MRLSELASIGALAAVLVVGVGCSEGSLPDTGGGGTAGDTSVDSDQPPNSDADGYTTPDPDGGDTTVDPDGGDTMDDDKRPPVEAFTSCGAGGVSTGNGVKAFQCYGPSEVSGAEASGNNVTWQAGSFRVITEP